MKKALCILFIVIAALPFVGMWWAGVAESAPSDAPRLSILSPHRREVKQEYARAFRVWLKEHNNGDANVVWLDAGGTSKMLKDLESRLKSNPDSPGVDILFGGGIDPYLRASKNGWIAPAKLPREVLDRLPPMCAGLPVFDEKQGWYGVALSGFGIIYSKAVCERLKLPEPKTWDDLAAPGFLSWIASGDPRSSGAVHMCYEIVLQARGYEEGWGLLTRLCANVRNFGESAGAAPREVSVGEAAAGMAIDQYAQTVIDEDGTGTLAFVLPATGTIINPDAIAMLKGSAQPELASKFIEFALSPEGQRILFQPVGVNGQRSALHRSPVLAGLYQEKGAPKVSPYSFKGDFKYDNKLGSTRWRLVEDMIGAWLIDSHPELAAAWKRVIAKGCQPADMAALCAPPVPAAEVAKLAAEMADEHIRSKLLSDWGSQARARYNAIAVK